MNLLENWRISSFLSCFSFFHFYCLIVLLGLAKQEGGIFPNTDSTMTIFINKSYQKGLPSPPCPSKFGAKLHSEHTLLHGKKPSRCSKTFVVCTAVLGKHPWNVPVDNPRFLRGIHFVLVLHFVPCTLFCWVSGMCSIVMDTRKHLTN